jgi:hypothetical protein
MAIFHDEPLGSLEAFVAVLSEIERGDRPPYPFYCALLYTTAGGTDARVSEYLESNWQDLDGMTGDRCLVFLIADNAPIPIVRGREFTPTEVYRVADELGIRASSLPCAAFFADPAGSRELLRVKLSEYLPPEATGPTFTSAFRGIADALNRCRPLDRDGRLDCLRAELVEEHKRLQPGPSADERVQQAGQRADSLQKVLTLGTSIAAVIGGVL